MHGGLALVVDGIDIQPGTQRHLYRLEHLGLCARILPRGGGAQPGCDHERRGVVLVGQPRVGAHLEQESHELGVGRPGGEQERGAIDEVQPGDAGRWSRRDSRVQVCALRDQLAGELEAGRVPRALRGGVVAARDAGLAHPAELVQRGPAARRGVGVGAAIQ